MMDVAVEVVRIFQRKFNEAVDEAVDLVASPPASPAASPASPTAPLAAPAVANTGVARSPLDAPPPVGQWVEIDRSADETYRWPDKNLDEYASYVRFRGEGDFGGAWMAIGTLENGEVTGFTLGTGGGSKRGITYFFPADDFAQTNELVSMVRGGGDKGKSGFGPKEPVPPAYAGFKTVVLKNRVAGKWNVKAVAVDADDVDGMLMHTFLQAKLRGLV